MKIECPTRLVRSGGSILSSSHEAKGGRVPNSPSPLKNIRTAGKALGLRGPLANHPPAQILHTLLCGLLGWIILNGVVISPFYAVHRTGSMAISAFAGLAFATALALLYRGFFRTASLVYLLGLWLPATLTILWNGGIHGVTMVFYIALPISAAWLLGYRASLITSGVCLGSSLAMALWEQTGLHLPRYVPGTPIATWFTILAAMIVAAVPVAHVLRILMAALTRSHQAQEALRESEGRERVRAAELEALMDAVPAAILIASDAECRHISGNRMAYDLLRRPPGTNLSRSAQEDIKAPPELPLQKAAASGEAVRHSELDVGFEDGTSVNLLGDAVPTLDEAGRPRGAVGVYVDVTGRKRADALLREAQKHESLGLLAGGVAHDFNNLLGSIVAEAELAASDLASGESPLEGIQRIRLVASRGAEIVRELMIYSGQDKAEPVEPVDLSQLVAEMLQLLKVSISKGVVLDCELKENLPAVLGRASQIRQIVMNLVMNASEAIGEKRGVIKVNTSRGVGDYLRLEVSDSGSGMTAEVQAKAFDPFFSTKFTGRGLGLAVVQGIVQDHGGTIHLLSAPDKGTTFEVFLPCVERAAQPHQIAGVDVVEKEPPTSGTVLIVEDEDVLRAAVSKLLRKRGVSVIEAIDGSSALELIWGQRGGIDLMLLDMTLPGASSREVLEQARLMSSHLKVILTSAYSRDIVDASFAGLRVDGFIRKPFQFGELIGLIQNALAGKSASLGAGCDGGVEPRTQGGEARIGTAPLKFIDILEQGDIGAESGEGSE
jgi:signal transduction histidine kinase/CheY-like chemotaxis protein